MSCIHKVNRILKESDYNLKVRRGNGRYVLDGSDSAKMACRELPVRRLACLPVVQVLRTINAMLEESHMKQIIVVVRG